MILSNNLLQVKRITKHTFDYPEIKDPSVAFANGKWYMYASIGRSDIQQWIVGRFVADDPNGVWEEIEPVSFVGIAGPQLCAPAVMFEGPDNTESWKMYIQTACFEENGVIAEATSKDGKVFSSMHASLITKQHISENKHTVVGVYDAGISTVTLDGVDYEVMIFSGYRQVGSGDIYLTWKKRDDLYSNWVKPRLILDQEDVPFHNKPGSEFFEWGLEGGKILQVRENMFILVGVCFLPLPRGYEGKRQRVFMAASSSLDGPYIPLGTPFPPQQYNKGMGEHGHPDSFVFEDKLIVIFQEREMDGKPWHLRIATFDLKKFMEYTDLSLSWSPQKEIHAYVHQH
jgi:hypothetical protein